LVGAVGGVRSRPRKPCADSRDEPQTIVTSKTRTAVGHEGGVLVIASSQLNRRPHVDKTTSRLDAPFSKRRTRRTCWIASRNARIWPGCDGPAFPPDVCAYLTRKRLIRIARTTGSGSDRNEG
jgi:hypothetical protein